ncbi:MAG: acyltransferase [Ilumatobacteraceae bacterium]|nr:acyltransferase [Ilumatobacteraceae bacterium]
MTTASAERVQTRIGKYAFLDGLRGWAALWVVFNHIQNHLPNTLNSIPLWVRDPLILRGGLGVPVFFVISGFVITRSIANIQMDAPNVGNFCVRRMARLTPPYYFSLLVALVVNYVSTLFKDESFRVPTLAEAVAHILYIPDLLHMYLINGVHWTLYVEVQFYLVLAGLSWLLTLRVLRESPHARTATLTAVAAVSLIWPLVIQLSTRENWFLPYLCAFVGGCFIYWFVNGTLVSWLYYGFGTLLGVAAVWHHQEVYVATFVAFVLISVATRVPGAMSRWLSDRVSQFLGKISFSLYLTHPPLIGVVYYFGVKVLGDSKQVELALIVPEITVCLIAGYIAYLLVERPAIAWSQRLKRPVPVATASA